MPDPVQRVALRYRPMNQALSFAQVEMQRAGARFVATIPGGELTGEYPLAYAFVIRTARGAWRVPGLGADLSARPYHVVRRRVPGPADRA
jgi:hypothetical protein